MALTQIGSDGVKDDAVTLAKQAAGTDGQIITYDASGNPVAVGPGTDGQVLTSTGAGSPPAFEAIPAAGAALTGSTNNTITTVTGANAIQGEANLTFDGTNLGVGITSPTTKLHSVQSDASAGNNLILDNNYSGGGTTTFLKAYRVGGAVGYALQYRDSPITIRQGTYTDHPMEFFTNDTARLTLETGGNVKVNDGDLVIGTAGHGINFSANSHASGMSSELLDVYEEGTFTPNIGTTSSGNSSGEYTKIGRLVHIKGFVSWSSHSNSGNVVLGGLPFTADGAGYAYLGDSRFVNLDSSHYSLGLVITGSEISFKENGDNTNAQNLAWSQLGNDTFMGFSGFYHSGT